MDKIRRLDLSACSRLIVGGLIAVVFIYAPKIVAASFTQGYHADNKVVVGAVVSTLANDATRIEDTTLNTEDLMAGVVTGSVSGIIDLQPKGSDLRVGTSGEVSLLVTDYGGQIKTGDYLIISPIAGVAMRDSPDSDAKKYIGIAKQDFNASAGSVRQIDVAINDGSTKKANAGPLKAQLLLQDRPEQKNKTSQNFFIVIGSKIAGKRVSAGQLIAATAVFATTISLTGLLLNSSVRGSFISLGRNPLSRPAIISNLLRVLSLCTLILMAGLTMSYIILLI